MKLTFDGFAVHLADGGVHILTAAMTGEAGETYRFRATVRPGQRIEHALRLMSEAIAATRRRRPRKAIKVKSLMPVRGKLS